MENGICDYYICYLSLSPVLTATLGNRCYCRNDYFLYSLSGSIQKKNKIAYKKRSENPSVLIYLSSLKYERPNDAGGWFSRFLRILITTSTKMVTTYGNIFISSFALLERPGM